MATSNDNKRITPEVKPADAVGDHFVTGFNRYADPAKAPAARMHLAQIVKNYERAFGHEPTSGELDAVFSFMESFFCEIGECYPNTRMARTASDVTSFLVEDAFETIQNISNLEQMNPRLALREGLLMLVEIPARSDHEGMYAVTALIRTVCPVCNRKRGEPYWGLSYDGSRRLTVSQWKNPCGHVDEYAAVREEIAGGPSDWIATGNTTASRIVQEQVEKAGRDVEAMASGNKRNF